MECVSLPALQAFRTLFRPRSLREAFFSNPNVLVKRPIMRSPFSHPEMSSEIGIYGLTAQGIQLALNMASKDCLVTVGNKSSDKVRSMPLSA